MLLPAGRAPTLLQLHRAFRYEPVPGWNGAFGGMMFWRGLATCIAAVFLSGCASERTGFDFAGVMQRLGPPRPGQSRIVVLQEKTGFSTNYCICDVKLDGDPMGRLKPGSYLYADRRAGRHELLAAETLFPGESKRDISTEAGRTYFFLARTSDRHNTVTGATIMGGLAGAVAASVVTAGSDSPGPVDFFPLDEATARTTVAGLQLAE
jgi:hypothetical protein